MGGWVGGWVGRWWVGERRSYVPINAPLMAWLTDRASLASWWIGWVGGCVVGWVGWVEEDVLFVEIP